MRAAAVFAALLFTLVSLVACNEDTVLQAHNFKVANLGIVSLSAPVDWPFLEKYDAASGTTTYQVDTPEGAYFKFFMILGDRKHMKLEGLRDMGLESFVSAKTEAFLPKTLEGRAIPQRFGFRKDGVYVRLTDNTEKPQYLYMTQGMRLPSDDAGVYFAFFSNQKNDQDEKQLKQVLAVIESIKVAPDVAPVEDKPE